MRDYLNEIKELEKENAIIKQQMNALDNHINDLYNMFGDGIFIDYAYEATDPEQKSYWEDAKLWAILNNIMRLNNRTIARLRAEYKMLHDDAYLATELIDIRKRIRVNDFIIGSKF